MCRLALQLLGMLGNVLGMLCNILSMLCNVLSMLATSLTDLGTLLQGPRSPTSKINSPTYCLISCEAKGVVYHQTSIYETWWYTTPLISQLSRAKRKNSEVNLEKYKIKILRFDFRSGLQFSILLLYISTVKIK